MGWLTYDLSTSGTTVTIDDAVSGEAAALARELDGLRTAMRSRASIEQAKGALMALHCCDADAAFEMLVQESQNRNLKLHQVAHELLVRVTKST